RARGWAAESPRSICVRGQQTPCSPDNGNSIDLQLLSDEFRAAFLAGSLTKSRYSVSDVVIFRQPYRNVRKICRSRSKLKLLPHWYSQWCSHARKWRGSPRKPPLRNRQHNWMPCRRQPLRFRRRPRKLKENYHLLYLRCSFC